MKLHNTASTTTMLEIRNDSYSPFCCIYEQ